MSDSSLLNQPLDFLHQIDHFQFWFIDRVRATLGLPLLIKDEIWKIYRINYGSVAVENGDSQRAIAFGELVCTEGLRSGALVPQRPNDPDDELILLEDRLRRICLDLSENFEIFAEEAARTAVARVVVTGLTNSNRVAKELNRFENASQIGNAYAGLLKIGPSHCELPTPSAELAKLSASDSLEWIGIHWPEGVIEEWKKSRFTSDQARELAVLGVKPSRLSIWLNYKGEQNETLPDFEFIKLWSSTSLLPDQCIEYTRCGLDPVEASSAHDFDVSPLEANMWRTIGVPFRFVPGWKMSYMEMEEISNWIQCGCLEFDIAKQWIQSGLNWLLFDKWKLVTINADEVVLCESNAISVEMLALWSSGFWGSHPFDLRLSWMIEGVGPNPAYSWILRSIPASIGAIWAKTSQLELSIFDGKEFDWAISSFNPVQAIGWRKLGVPLSDAIFAVHHSVSFERFSEWKDFQFDPPQSNKRKIEWISLGVPIDEVATWLSSGVKTALEAKQIMSDGFTSETIAKYRNSQLKIKADLENKLKYEKEQKRLLKQQQVEQQRQQKQQQDALINALISSATPAWLQEIQDRANYVQPLLRKTLGTKNIFEYRDELSISVDFIGGVVTGLLIYRDVNTEVEFDPEDFEPLSVLKSPLKRLTLGLAISWFIDCTIVLRGISTASETIFQSRQEGGNSHRVNEIRYVPTQTFHQSERRVRDGERIERVIHSVKGHIRTLDSDHSPSDEARKRAPIYLRSKLKVNETYVRPHERGVEEKSVNDYLIRLSKYSATANAFGEL